MASDAPDTSGTTRSISSVGPDRAPGAEVAPILPDRYKISSVAGQGGMGRVYRAFDSLLNREVAIKMLFQDTQTLNATHDASPAAHNSATLREARAMAAFSHPGLCRVIDVQTSDGTCEIFIGTIGVRCTVL